MSGYDELQDLARVFRSKNAGPFITTIDIFLSEAKHFYRVTRSGVLTAEHVAQLYNVPPSYVLGIYYYEPVYAIKVSIIKTIPSSDVFCPDVMGAQQHVPLLHVRIPRGLIEGSNVIEEEA